MKTLIEWLRVDCKAWNVVPVVVCIDGQVWHNAARYSQTFEYQAGMDAVSRGEKKAGDTYVHEAIYVVGELPRNYNRKGDARVCYPFNGEEWYVAGYMLNENLMATNAEYHPFGAHFMLCPWRVPSGEKIDKYEPKPYTRLEMMIEAQPEATVADTPAKIEAWRLLSLKAALKLEMLGMKKSRGPSAFAMVKKEFGFRGVKSTVYNKFLAMLKEKGILPSHHEHVPPHGEGLEYTRKTEGYK